MSTRRTTSQSASDLDVKLSNPDKIFWPEEGYTKQDLAEFYAGIFPLLQPYVDNRLLTLERCPDGMNGDCFYQKEKPQGMPADTPTIRVESPEGKRKAVNYVVGGKLETQLALVNLEIRAGTAREEAFRNLGERTGLDDIKSLMAMLIQTDRFGTSIAQALRVQADTLRTKRRQRAEEAAAKTTIKLVFPLVLFIFPAMFVVILGSAIIQIFEALGRS